LKRHVAAVAVAVAGLGSAAALAVSAFLSLSEPARFVAPGAGSVEVKAPGRYVIWHEYRSTFENRVYRADPGLPAGARFTVRGPDGPPLPVGSAGSQSWKGGDVERQAIGRFEAPGAGRYTVVLDGPFPPMVIAVTPDFMGRLLLSIGGAVLLALFGIGAGIGLFVYALGARPSVVKKPAMNASREPAPPGAHQELRDMATLVYALYAASILLGITLVGGVVVAYLKRDEAAGTWLESHYRWQIRTFWWALLWGATGFITTLILVGFAVLFGAAVWFIYRVAKGWLALRAGRTVGPGVPPPGAPGQVAL
jgi:uncharacterized membrane protein